MGNINTTSRRNNGTGGRWGVTALIALVCIAIAVGATLFFTRDQGKSSTTISVDQVRELATLATAEAKVTLVKEEVDHKIFGKDLPVGFIPGTQRKILLVIPATVLAGVDLESMTAENFNVNEELKEIQLVLPRATIMQDPSIQMDDVKTYSDRGLLSGDVKWDEGFELAAIAQDEIEQEAIEFGLLNTAEDNAEKVLKGFFENLGYTVKVTFK